MTPIVLPDADWEGVEPGTEALMDRWLVTEGTQVSAGQAIGRVVLVKATLEVTAPVAGVLARILVPAEETFKRGTVLAELREQ
jgi:pyruvate/2-oxoglutarate dehydrogenase complex dihydrolipoamide acyltransferase (E2) component